MANKGIEMRTKQRIEDLGRIAEKLNKIIELEIFSERDTSIRCKNIENDEEQKRCYQIETLLELLYECYEIARYGDEDLKL